MTDDHLHRFATKVVELRERAHERVDEELMREVAKDLGMTEAELLAVKEESQAHKQRARALRAAGDLDGALAELDTAWTFNPLDVEVMYLLADALHTHAVRTKDASEWQRAKDLCARVLEIAPAHAEAPGLMNAIKNADPAKRATGVGGGLVVALAVAALFVAATIALLLG